MYYTKKPRPHRGFTLIELLVVLTLIAILAAIGVPSFREMIKNNRVTGQNNELVAMLNFAKSEAVRRSTTVTVTLSSDGNSWSGGVPDPTGEADVANCPLGVLRCALGNRVALDPTTFSVSFNSRGYIVGDSDDETVFAPDEDITLRLQHQDCRPGARQSRVIEILPTGLVTSMPSECE